MERRACHVLVADRSLPAEGAATYLPANKLTLDATLWVDQDKKLYLVYCHEWVQNQNGTVGKI